MIFLEGPIQTGKSTLIRELLGEHLRECGGFTSQRLIRESGETCGFRIGPASTTPLTAPVAGFRPGPAPSIDDGYAGDGTPVAPAPEYLLASPDGGIYSGVFKYFDPMGNVHKTQEVFDILGVHYLTSSRNKPLILLDELGGSELLCEPFRRALYDVLSSGVPCLGVLKLADNARRMQRSYGFDDAQKAGQAAGGSPVGAPAETPTVDAPAPVPGPSIVDRNLELRSRILEDFGGQVLYYERTSSGNSSGETLVRDAVTGLIRSVFG